MKVSIIIPAYNEEKRIGKTLQDYTVFFDKLASQGVLTYEILVVINNTKDRTEEVVKEFMKKNLSIRYLNFKQVGKGFAITQGFKDALKRDNDVLGFVDADMATPPASFYELIKSCVICDGAIANRYDALSSIYPKMTFRRTIVARVFNLIVRLLFFVPYRDTQCGAKVLRRRVVENILPHFTITQWAYDIDLLYLAKKNGFHISSCPTEWHDKEGSKVRIIGSSIEMLFAVIQLRVFHSPFSRLLKPIKRPIGRVYRFLLSRKTLKS